MPKYRVIFSNNLILYAVSSLATYHQLAINNASKTAMELASKNHLFVSIAHIKPSNKGVAIDIKPTKYIFCALKKSHLKLAMQLIIKMTAKT